MDNMKNSESKNNAYNNSGNTFQGQNKHDAAPKSGGCGCGCKAAPVEDEDVIEIEEDDLVY